MADMGDPDRWELPGVWGVGGSHSIAAPTPVASVSSQPQPRFMIEYLTSLAQQVDGYVVDDPDGPLGVEPIEVFRITARGVGATENAVVILQSTYARGISAPSEDVGLFADARMGRLSWRELGGVY